MIGLGSEFQQAKPSLGRSRILSQRPLLPSLRRGSRHLFAGERDTDPAEGFRAGLRGPTPSSRSGILQGFEMGVHSGSPIGGAHYATSRGWGSEARVEASSENAPGYCGVEICCRWIAIVLRCPDERRRAGDPIARLEGRNRRAPHHLWSPHQLHLDRCGAGCGSLDRRMVTCAAHRRWRGRRCRCGPLDYSSEDDWLTVWARVFEGCSFAIR